MINSSQGLSRNKISNTSEIDSRNIFYRTKMPLTRVSKPVPGVDGKEGAWRGDWQKRLAKGWRKVGEGLAGFLAPSNFGNSRGTRLEDLVCESMVGGVWRSE